MKRTHLSAVMMLVLSTQALTASSWETEDKKASAKNFKAQVTIEKENEAKVRKEWKELTEDEKDASLWTPWYRQKIIPALFTLAGMRKKLYRENLFDSYIKRPENPNLKCSDYDLANRRLDGTCNVFDDKLMGSAWTRFARNINLLASYTDESTLLSPGPRDISLELFTRDTFKPVTFLNLLAVGWIQYMTHDWFGHGDNESAGAYVLPLKSSVPLFKKGMRDMIIPMTRVDTTRSVEDEKKTSTYLLK